MRSFLVVSNDNSVQNFLKKTLDKHSVVHAAEAWDGALHILLNNDIDVTFLDTLLKEKDMDQFLEGLRQTNIDPTIVALVPPAQPIFSEVAMRIGAYELVERPLRKEAIQHAVKRALERQELKKELNFVKSQTERLKPDNKDSESFGYAPTKQTCNGNLQLSYNEVFQKFSKVLTHVYDLSKLADLTVEAMSEIFRVGRVMFLLSDKGHNVFKPYRCIGVDEVATRNICLTNDQGVMLWLTRNHQILNKDVVEKELPLPEENRQETINIQKEMNLLRAQLCIPIFAKGNLVGAVALGNKITGKSFFEEDIELLSMLARYIGMAVENALLYREVYLAKVHNEMVLENIPCGVIAIDKGCKVNTFNKSAAEMLDIPSEDVLGKDVKHIGSTFADILLRALKDKETHQMKEIVNPVTHFACAVSTSLLLDADRELGAIMVFSDLRAVKKLESRVKDLEQQAFYHLLGKNMAHYVKNHLVAVKTFIDLFPQKREDQEFVTTFSNIANAEVDKLDAMVGKLTSLGGNGGAIKRKLDVRLPVGQALDCHGDELEKSNIKVVEEYTKEAITIYADCEKLEEAFSDLVLNAIEAMPNGGTLTVKILKTFLDERKLKEIRDCLSGDDIHSKHRGINIPAELNTEYVEVIVKDTGIGIPQNELRNIFLPFYTTKTHNIGLGISITRRTIEEHNGLFYVSTKERKGSNFHILLPFVGSK